jgi:hypothetical protein
MVMAKTGYETPIVWLVLFNVDDIVTASIDVGVDGSSQDGWWGND